VVFPIMWGLEGFTSGESATAEEIIFPIDFADTFPCTTKSLPKSAALCGPPIPLAKATL
jgi:hypothetical protein